jgi:hypothetical protein
MLANLGKKIVMCAVVLEVFLRYINWLLENIDELKVKNNWEFVETKLNSFECFFPQKNVKNVNIDV